MDPQEASTKLKEIDPNAHKELAVDEVERASWARTLFTYLAVGWVGIATAGALGVVLYLFKVLIWGSPGLPAGLDQLLLALFGVQTIGGLLLWRILPYYFHHKQ